jgi:hypothetical protein
MQAGRKLDQQRFDELGTGAKVRRTMIVSGPWEACFTIFASL